MAVVSGTLPFAIWNLKGYLDTIPKELEEAAAVDGCTRNQSFFKIVLPLATPALAVTGFLGFVAGWTEFYFVSIFLNDPSQGFTLSLALNKMVGAFGQTPWSDFAASRSCSRRRSRSCSSSSRSTSSAALRSAG